MEGKLRTVSFSELGKLGRLGNSLFQVSATWNYGLKHNRIVQLPEWAYFKYFKFPFRANGDIRVDKNYIEPAFHFNELPEFEEEQVNLSGYFQSYLYSKDIDLNVLFELKDEWRKSIDELYEKINPKRMHTCSVHVRRGDYLNPGTNEYHGVLPMQYYDDAAISLYGNRFSGEEKPLFLMFSDDISWCKENFKHPNIYFSEVQSMASSKEDYDIIDMYLMAKCNDNIIANSSFSYWSALLNKNKNKRVVAPKNWFSGAKCDTKDLYLPEWIKI